MIKAGDKVKFKKYDETIYTVVNVEEEHVRVINITGTQLMQVRKDFIDVVEQYIDYKQRADELEKRWNELRGRLIETCKSDRTVAKQYTRSFLCLLDELEGKENVFETVQSLENDNA